MKKFRSITLKQCLIGVSILSLGQVFGATSYVSGTITDGTSWDNLLPGPGNPGTIGVDASFGTINFVLAGPTTITHSAGTITGNSPNIAALPAQPLSWIQDGGSVSADNFFSVNWSTSYELRSGSVAFDATTGGSRFFTSNTGTFLQTGGTTNGIGFEFGSSGLNVLSGGVGNDLGAAWLGAAIRVLNSTLEINGDYTANFNPGFTNGSGLSGGAISVEGTGVLNFSSTWSGSFNNTAFDGGTQWQDALTASGVQIDGTQVTAGNFGDFFEISNNGATVSAIPEPSSTALLGLGGLALLLRRRK